MDCRVAGESSTRDKRSKTFSAKVEQLASSLARAYRE